uniref:U-megalopygitoxin(3)-Mo4 n=1 Tax=Megalopyge opercularis TaxID=1113279 RepID=TXU34_MEGOP|nr:venom protein U-MPTX.3-4 [Megalopyge opercularis]
MNSKFVLIVVFLAVVSICFANEVWDPEKCGCPPFDKVENAVCTKDRATYDNRCQFDCHAKFLSKSGKTLEESPCIESADPK